MNEKTLSTADTENEQKKKKLKVVKVVVVALLRSSQVTKTEEWNNPSLCPASVGWLGSNQTPYYAFPLALGEGTVFSRLYSNTQLGAQLMDDECFYYGCEV